MKQTIAIVSSLMAIWLTACGSTSEPQAPDGQGERQQLIVKGECTFEECSSPPSSLSSEPTLECKGSGGSDCNWSRSDGSVSHTACAESECPERPDVACPGDTVQRVQTCGRENDGECAWSTTCVPPRETTPCPVADGCNGQPLLEIGVICSDGSTGGFVCVSDDTRCYWERSCD